VAIATGQEVVVELAVPVPGAVPWEPDRPFLYQAAATLAERGEPIDAVSDRFGMRTIAVGGKQILLNGRPVFLRGWLSDAIYPEQIGPTLTAADVRRLLDRAKEHGFTFVRHHTHPPVPVFHAVADEVGILQLQEFASHGSIGNPRLDPTQRTRRQIAETWRQLIERDRNHPSLIAYGVNNECWNEPEFRVWAPLYRDLYAAGKALDPTRLILDNSGGEDRWSVASDLYDKHTYHFPSAKEMARLSRVGKRPYLRSREAYFNVDLATVAKPCLVSEVGGWCTFPDFAGIRARHDGELPWWLTRDPVRNPRMYHEVITRMEEGFARVGLEAEYATIVANSERYAGMGNKLQVEQIRQTPGIAGYAYCTFTDCYNWTAGVLDNELEAKSHAGAWARLNQASVVLWPRDRWCFRTGETVPVALTFSHFGDHPIRAGRLAWWLRRDGEVIAEGGLVDLAIPSYEVRDLPPFELVLPSLAASARLRFEVEIADSDHVLRNAWDLWALADSALASERATIGLFDPAGTHGALGERFPALVPVDDGQLGRVAVLVATKLTERVVAFLEQGGKVLWLEDGREPNCRAYRSTPAVDYHATIVRDHPALGTFPHAGWCDLQFHHLIGRAVLDTGFFDPDRLAPIVEAIHVPFATHGQPLLPFRRKGFLVEAGVEAGLLVATTFIFDGVREQPETAALFGELVRYLLNPAGDPAYALTGDDLREWAWGSVQGELEYGFVEFSMY
jgi:hypothetical protein